MNLINSSACGGQKRTRDEGAGSERSNRRRISELDHVYMSRMNFIFNSLGGISDALSKRVPLSQEQRERLVVFVQDIDSMRQKGLISQDTLADLFNILRGICNRDAPVAQSIGQQVRFLGEFI